MKKHIKKALALFMVSATLVSTLSWANAQSPVGSFECVPLENDPEILQLNDGTGASTYSRSVDRESNLARAEVAYDSLMRSFYEAQPDFQKYQEGCYTVSGIAAEGFPEEYAGAYINKDLNLVVLLTENCTQTTRALTASEASIAQAANSEDMIYASAEYSYSYLVSLMDEIYQYTLSGKNGDDGFNVVHYSLDDFGNRVIVGLENIDSASITAFKAVVCDSDAISFEVTDPSSFELDGSPGYALNIASYGFRAYKYENKQNTYGFVTAAHCFLPGETVYDGYTTSYAYGTARPDLWRRGGDMDAVFVESDSPNSTWIVGTDGEHLRAGIDANLAQGDPLIKSGKNTKVTDGIVKYISGGFIWENLSYFDFGVSDYRADNGDSGGIVASTRTGQYWIAGIHSGRYDSDQEPGTTYSHFCKAINITTRFGLTLY